MDNLQQFELFDNIEKDGNLKSSKPQNSASVDFWRFKRAIFFLIYSIVILIIGFVFGVEHGKSKTKINDVKSITRADDENRSLAARSAKPESQVSGIELKNKFSIKLASFRNLSSAQAELKILKIKGYAAYLINSKGYLKLYAGPFKTREEAETMLRALKMRYPDCFIPK